MTWLRSSSTFMSLHLLDSTCFIFHKYFTKFSPSVASDSVRPHGLRHARPPCLSLTPGAYSNSCPSRWWCHPTISSFVVPFSSCLHSFSASESFQMSQFFASGGQSIGISTLHQSLQWIFWIYLYPMNMTSFRMDWLDLLAFQRTLKSLLQHHSSKASILRRSAFFMAQLSHPYMTTGKTISFD